MARCAALRSSRRINQRPILTPMKAGTYQVRVTPPQVIDPADGSPPPKPIENADIPAKYREYQTSGLTTTIGVGTNEFNVELK